MNIEAFTEWLHRQGHRVVRTASTGWYEIGPRIFQAFPYHHVIDPPEAELRGFLLSHSVIGLRYSTHLTSAMGCASYHVVRADKRYLLEDLPKKARYDVRKGLGHASVEPISFARLAAEGWTLRAETLARQGRTGAETEAWWRRLCASADGLQGFEAWAALHEGQPVAALLACTIGDCCSILYQQSLTAHLNNGVNNALTFGFTSEALLRPDVSQVFYGLHSLDAPASVDEFKFRMGYTARAVRQRVVFHPLLAPLFNPASHGALRHLRRWRPENPTLAKAEGMVRFYLEGRRPLIQQDWPQALVRGASEGAPGD